MTLSAQSAGTCSGRCITDRGVGDAVVRQDRRAGVEHREADLRRLVLDAAQLDAFQHGAGARAALVGAVVALAVAVEEERLPGGRWAVCHRCSPASARSPLSSTKSSKRWSSAKTRSASSRITGKASRNAGGPGLQVRVEVGRRRQIGEVEEARALPGVGRRRLLLADVGLRGPCPPASARRRRSVRAGRRRRRSTARAARGAPCRSHAARRRAGAVGVLSRSCQ